MTVWKTLELGEVCTLQRGMDLPKRLRTDGDFPLVTSSGIDGTHSVGPISGPGVVTGRYGTIGKVFFVETDFWPLNTTLYVKNFHGNDPRFVHYLLKTVDFQSHSGKSGVPGVNRNDVHQEFVHIPEARSEQEAIAQTLYDADALMNSLEQLLTKKRQIKQGIMQELLSGKRRLPGFEDEWKLKRLGELAELLKGSGLSKDVTTVSGSRKCILYGELFTTYGQVIQDVVGRTNSRDGLISIAGDVLVPGSTTTDGIDLATASALLESGVALGGDINIIRPRSADSFNSRFLANYLTHVKKRDIAERAQGSTIVHLYGRDLSDLWIHLPSKAEQEAIANVLSTVEIEITALETSLIKAQDLKQAMAQALLTGRIRLVEPKA